MRKNEKNLMIKLREANKKLFENCPQGDEFQHYFKHYLAVFVGQAEFIDWEYKGKEKGATTCVSFMYEGHKYNAVVHTFHNYYFGRIFAVKPMYVTEYIISNVDTGRRSVVEMDFNGFCKSINEFLDAEPVIDIGI